MKKSIALLNVLLVFVLFQLAGCSTPAKTGLPDAFQGVWVKASYLEKLTETRSPFLASDELTEVVAMYIDFDAAQTRDSVLVTVNWNNHEGYELTLYGRPGKQAGHWQAAFPYPPSDGASIELGFEGDQLVLYTYQSDGALQKAVRFSKVMEKPNDQDGAGLQKVVNERLFAGKYLILENNQPVYMSAEGLVEGFEEAAFYHVSTDFMITIENNFDLIDFVRNGAAALRFTYQFTGDTLHLFEVFPDEDSVYYLKGQPVYQLLKLEQ